MAKEKVLSDKPDKPRLPREDYNSIESRAARKMNRCKIQLGNYQPFFGLLLMHLTIVEDSNMEFKTMDTDGRNLYYDPDFVMEHSDEEIKWTLCHEVMHCALKHFLRRQANKDYWNLAADYAINQLISDLPIECGKQVSHTCGSPEDELKNHKGEFVKNVVVGWSAEMVYQYLLKHNIDLPPVWVNSPGGGKGKSWRIGDVLDPPPPKKNKEEGDTGGGGDPDDEESKNGKKTGSLNILEDDLDDPERLGEYWERALKESMDKNIGNLPESFKRKLLILLKPQIDWKNLLKRFVISFGEKHKYDIPHRRFIGENDIQWTRTPTISSFDSMVLMGDTSGSIGQTELTGMVTEAYEILKIFKPKEIHVIWCDAKVHLPVEIATKSNLTPLHSPKGGGGTDFRPPFKWVKENLIGKKKLGPIVYFTDGCGPFPTDREFGLSSYKQNVVWVIVGTKGYINKDVKIPFGTRIDLIL